MVHVTDREAPGVEVETLMVTWYFAWGVNSCSHGSNSEGGNRYDRDAQETKRPVFGDRAGPGGNKIQSPARRGDAHDVNTAQVQQNAEMENSHDLMKCALFV